MKLTGYLAVATLSLLIASPALANDREDFIDRGAEPVSPQEKAEMFPGKTLVGEGWKAEYRTDGTKMVTAGGNTKALRYWTAEDGTMCEELWNGGEQCDTTNPQYDLYRLGEEFRAFDKDGDQHVRFTMQ
jgi:hypothetical protein